MVAPLDAPYSSRGTNAWTRNPTYLKLPLLERKNSLELVVDIDPPPSPFIANSHHQDDHRVSRGAASTVERSTNNQTNNPWKSKLKDLCQHCPYVWPANDREKTAIKIAI
ncbi:hypothetical protein PM082_013543 [Marasmius tenuissimus]|nr:hypothetical protein PM082_013543 [Marasmius tenuissimus]